MDNNQGQNFNQQQWQQAPMDPAQQQWQAPMDPMMMPPMPPMGPLNEGKGFSIAGLALGIVSVVGALLFWVFLGLIGCWIAVVCGVLGIVFGVIGRKKSIAVYGRPSSIATAGFVLGIVGTCIAGLLAISCTACVCLALETYEEMGLV